MLYGIIEEKEKELTVREAEADYDVAKKDDNITHRSANNQKSILSKLRELDE